MYEVTGNLMYSVIIVLLFNENVKERIPME